MEADGAEEVDAAAGAPSLFAGAGESADELLVLPESPLDSLLDAAGLTLPYPSLNQPPPLNEMAGAEITRSSAPPQ